MAIIKVPCNFTYLKQGKGRETVVLGHVEPAKSFPWFSFRPSEGRWSSWETLTAGNLLSLQQTQMLLSPPFSAALFLVSFLVYHLSAHVEKYWQSCVPVVKWLFLAVTFSLSPRYPRCSQSCVKMSKLCK